MRSYRVKRNDVVILVTEKWHEVTALTRAQTEEGELEITDADGAAVEPNIEEMLVIRRNYEMVKALSPRPLPTLLARSKHFDKMVAAQEKLQLIRLGKRSALPANKLTKVHRAYCEKTVNDMALEARSWLFAINCIPE